MKSICIALALATAAPTLAQTPAAAPTAAKPALDPERLALAGKAVEAMIPPGTMQRMMKHSMGGMENALMGGMLDMKASDVCAEKCDPKDKGKTLRQAMAEKDPHFEERMRITNRVMADEMGAIFTRMEPRLKSAMTRAYARRFTVAELTEINLFFASPAGASFARQSFEMSTDPEMTAEMMAFMPEMMKDMPAIAEKLKKATSHLPEPPKDKDDADEDRENEATPTS
jgi:hypothetical protein